MSAGKESSKFFFNPLRSRALYLFVSAHFLFAIFLGEIFAFAPDEGGYLSNFSQLYKPGFTSAALLGWQQVPVFSLRIIYAPASFVHLLGVPSYLSIRLLSIFTSTAALYLVLCFWRFNSSGEKRTRKDLLLIALIPSLFLWTTLGLRESFIFLSLALICVGLFLLSQEIRKQGFVLEFLGLWLLLNSKNYLFVLAMLALLMQIAYRSIRYRKILKFDTLLLVAIALPLVMYPPGAKVIGTGIVQQAKTTAQSLAAPTLTPTPSASPMPAPGIKTPKVGKTGRSPLPIQVGTGSTPIPTVSQDPGMTVTSLMSDLKKHPHSLFSQVLSGVGLRGLIELSASPTPSSMPTKLSDAIPGKSLEPSNSVSPASKRTSIVSPTKPTKPAASATPKQTPTTAAVHRRMTSRMNVTKASLRDPASVVIRAGGFLFTPFPFIDNGSLFLDISALEAPFWWFIYITFGIAVWRRFRRKELDRMACFAITFIGMFIAFSALTEVNVGTMIRHRSVLLIPVLFLTLPLTKSPGEILEKTTAKRRPEQH